MKLIKTESLVVVTRDGGVGSTGEMLFKGTDLQLVHKQTLGIQCKSGGIQMAIP